MSDDDDGRCHLPRCTEPRVTLTLCAWHAWRLLGRRPVDLEHEDERNKAA